MAIVYPRIFLFNVPNVPNKSPRTSCKTFHGCSQENHQRKLVQTCSNCFGVVPILYAPSAFKLLLCVFAIMHSFEGGWKDGGWKDGLKMRKQSWAMGSKKPRWMP